MWHQLTEKGGCQVTGDIPIDEILVLSLFCIIYRYQEEFADCIEAMQEKDVLITKVLINYAMKQDAF